MIRLSPARNFGDFSDIVVRVECGTGVMSIVLWSDEYKVGNAELDHQHEHILSLLNALEVAGTSGEGAATSDVILSHLLRYLKKHFSDEEHLMTLVGYPEVASHRQQHENCKATLAQLVSSVESGEGCAGDCMPFLNDWLHSHMLGLDRQYASWLHAQPEALARRASEVTPASRTTGG